MSLSESTPSPIRGTFIPVSGPQTQNQEPSASSPPKGQGTDLGLHFHLNLTDSQMERLASALPGHYSPQKAPRQQDHGTETIKIGMAPKEVHMASHKSRGGAYESSRSRHGPSKDHRGGGDRDNRHKRDPDDLFVARNQSSRSRSPAKRSNKSSDKGQVQAAVPRSQTGGEFELPERRKTPRPAPVDMDSVRQYGSVSKKTVVIERQPGHHSQKATTSFMPPSTPPLRRVPKIASPVQSESYDDDSYSASSSSSYYSEDDFGQAHPSYISPLRVRKAGGSDDSALQAAYTEWVKDNSLMGSNLSHSPSIHSPQRRGLHQTAATTGDLRYKDLPHPPRNYSPLSDYLGSHVQPVRKQMVGTHGWLERTTTTTAATTTVQSTKKENEGNENHNSSNNSNNINNNINNKDKKNDEHEHEGAQPSQHKKRGFLNNLMKIAKDVTTSARDITSSASRRPRERGQRPSRLTVSLDPREQSLLYCELEFLITTALDGYINSQFSSGRLDADKYKKVVDGWQQRGRPKVVGFRYDLETQLDLVLLHSEDFRFYGKRAGLLAAVNGVLDMMRVDARALRIRTFCQPDTVIAKQLLDAQSLFNLIGCCEQQQIQLAEVIQFFKVILEREQYFRRDDNPVHSRRGSPEYRGRNAADTGTDPRSSKRT